jgi:hypothetical protein
MGKMLYVCAATVALALTLCPLVNRRVMADEKSARADSATELGKTWRYPGTENDIEVSGPLGEKLKNLDRTTVQFSKAKASFADVWNFYAGKCGYKSKWKENSIHMIIETTEGKGQRMVVDQDGETHFGLFTEQSVVHVQIRKVDAEHTQIRILTTLK